MKLISAEELKRKINEQKIVSECMKEFIRSIIDDLEGVDFTPVDFTPVVRCKDCELWGIGEDYETENAKVCRYTRLMEGMNGFCVYGEKKVSE